MSQKKIQKKIQNKSQKKSSHSDPLQDCVVIAPLRPEHVLRASDVAATIVGGDKLNKKVFDKAVGFATETAEINCINIHGDTGPMQDMTKSVGLHEIIIS